MPKGMMQPTIVCSGDRALVACKQCGWQGYRKMTTAKNLPCRKCKSTDIKFIDMAQHVSNQLRRRGW